MNVQMGLGGYGYDTRGAERAVCTGDVVQRASGEHFVVRTVDRDCRDTLVLGCTSLVDGREVTLLGARGDRPQEWRVHFAR